MRSLLIVPWLLWPTTAWTHDNHRDHALPRAIGDRNTSDPRARVPRSIYRSVTAATKTFRPVDPLPWDQINRRVAPQPK
jgi:hypothetical protein